MEERKIVREKALSAESLELGLVITFNFRRKLILFYRSVSLAHPLPPSLAPHPLPGRNSGINKRMEAIVRDHSQGGEAGLNRPSNKLTISPEKFDNKHAFKVIIYFSILF